MTTHRLPPFFFRHAPDLVVVGLSGKARSGKDFLADQLLSEGYIPISLANHFKISAMAKGYVKPKWWHRLSPARWLPAPSELDIKQMWEADKDAEHRHALQHEGTENGRLRYGEDVWCRHAEAWMYYFYTKGFRKFVITDVRFPNEANWIKSLGGAVYRVFGRGGLSGEAAKHPSETAVDNYRGFTAMIDNSVENEAHSIDQLKNLVEKYEQSIR